MLFLNVILLCYFNRRCNWGWLGNWWFRCNRNFYTPMGLYL